MSGVLSRPRFLPQQRLDLEDLEALLSGLRTDSKLYTKQFLANTNYVVKGFAVTGIGLQVATVNMSNATLLIPANTDDFSWFTSAPAEPNITITDADLTDGVRNYVEIELQTETNTPLTKAFWDPEANSGLGQEFNQIVDTMIDLGVNIVVLTGGFSGSADRLPLCIIDTHADGTIKSILDRRILLYRQGTPSDPENPYTWVSNVEPPFSINITAPTGTFVAGETVTFSGGATAEVVTGGTTDITIKLPTSLNLFPANTITGGTSGATGTVNTISESFVGADKSIGDLKTNDLAIKEEIRRIKGTTYWHELPFNSLQGVSSVLNSVIVPISTGAKFIWTGSALQITDSVGGPADADVCGKIRLFGTSRQLSLTRQDGTGGSANLTIADGEVLYITLPATGNQVYSAQGSGAANFKVAAMAAFVPSDTNYWLAYREGAKLAVRGQSDLSAGESAPIGDSIPGTLLANLGLADEITAPSYSSNIRGTALESMVSRDGVLTHAMGDAQEDRSAYAWSATPISWDGSSLTFASDIVVDIVNTKTGTSTSHTILAANSPVALAANESWYISIDRTSASENVTPVKTTVTPIPAQTQANKDIFVIAKRKDVSSVHYLVLPFIKQVVGHGETQRIGQTGADTALDNLTVTAINLSLVPGVDNSINLGSSSKRWATAYVGVIDNGAANPLNIVSSAVKRGASTSRYVNQLYVDAITLTGSQSAVAISNFTVAFASINGQQIDYIIKDGTSLATRQGTIRVSTDGTNVAITDLFTETADAGVTWAAAINGSNLEIRVTTTANTKTMRADIKQFLT